jgi:predicted RNase H-like HicB family nuclease
VVSVAVEDGAIPKYSKGEALMKRRTIQVRIFRGDKKYVAECMDLPVVTQGDTLDEVTANIQEAIGLHLEDEDLAELGIAPDPTIVATMELDAVA